MGFFNNLPKDNYTIIAETTTKYYLELTKKYRDRFDNEEDLLATTGVLDAQAYIFSREPQITVSEIIDVAKETSTIVKEAWMRKNIEGHHRGEPLNVASFITRSSGSTEPLVDFVIELEVKIFQVESPRFALSDIVEACLDKTKTITKAIQRTKQNYTGEKLFSLAVANFMELPRFEPIRKELGIIELDIDTSSPNLPKE